MIAVTALLVAVRVSHRVEAETRWGKQGAPTGVRAESGEAAAPTETAVVPGEVTAAWVQFLRDDLANAANALNSRLNVIANMAAELEAGFLQPEKKKALEQIRTEVTRATRITGGLLHRVTAAAPDITPPAWNILREGPVRPGHILVVEDDASNRGVITRLFEHVGHRVTPVSNGIEAYDILQRGGVDCIICDLRMPYLGGKGLYEQVEKLMPSLASRFVFVTGDYTRPASRDFLLHAGQPVIGKPYEVNALLAAVATVLTTVGVVVERRQEGDAAEEQAGPTEEEQAGPTATDEVDESETADD